MNHDALVIRIDVVDFVGVPIAQLPPRTFALIQQVRLPNGPINAVLNLLGDGAVILKRDLLKPIVAVRILFDIAALKRLAGVSQNFALNVHHFSLSWGRLRGLLYVDQHSLVKSLDVVATSKNDFDLDSEAVDVPQALERLAINSFEIGGIDILNPSFLEFGNDSLVTGLMVFFYTLM